MPRFSKLITPMRPTSHNLTIFFSEKLPAKIMDLRFDTLSQLLYASAVSPTSGPVLVMDETQGLIVGALLERMNGAGKLVGLHERDVGNYEIIKEMNFTPEQLRCLTTFPWSRLDTEIVLDLSIPPGGQDKVEERLARRKYRYDQLSEAKAMLDASLFQSLVIATSFAVLPIVKKVLPYLAGSASIVIYSPDKEVCAFQFNTPESYRHV
jgi:tRNA (adenine-N(1)-)-methyltransferase non-catalytic subunit